MKKKLAIALSIVLLLAIAVGTAYRANLETYYAVYILPDDTGEGVEFEALNLAAAWRYAERHRPPGAELAHVILWPYDKNYQPPPPSEYSEEEGEQNAE